MKPLDSIETPKTRLGRPATSPAGAPFPPFLSGDGKDAAVRRRPMTGTSTGAGYFDADLATPPERKRRRKANDNILLEAAKMQTTRLSRGTDTHAAGEGLR